MRNFLILSTLFLFLITSASAQPKTVTIKNIRFHTFQTSKPTDKVVMVDDLSADIYTSNDIIHVKVTPCEPAIQPMAADSEDANIATLGTILVVSEKRNMSGFGVSIKFDLTDGDVTFPCLYSGTAFTFLHRFSNEEIIFKNDPRAQKIRLLTEPQFPTGPTVTMLIQASFTNLPNRTETLRSRRLSRRSSTNRK